MALDLVVRGGTVVTPQGVGPWDVGVQGERIAVLALPGTLPTDGARVLDASGRVVAPGGVEPHTHLAHAIRTRPDDPGLTLGPEEDTRGMACGGTTTHIDFAFVRPGSSIAETLEQRAARWAGRSHVDYSFHVTLCGALPFAVFAEMREAIEAGSRASRCSRRTSCRRIRSGPRSGSTSDGSSSRCGRRPGTAAS